MHLTLKALVAAGAMALAAQAAAQVTFYEGEGFRGRAFTVDKQMWDLDRTGFNDRARSAVVDRGRWEVCEDSRFQGRCTVLRPGSYESLSGMGMDNKISSVRPVNRTSYENEAPPPVAAAPVYEYRQRPSERLFQAPVSSVHAVVGPPEQRCWVERERVRDYRGENANVGGAVVGAIIGGVLGHQVGGGRGRDVATAGGAVAGAAVGANTGGGSYGREYGQNVQRCSTVPSDRPEYWDVTYNFRGLTHRVQMSAPPGPTITVNGNGEPRG